MNFFDYKAVEVLVSKKEISVLLEDGRKRVLPLSRFPLLNTATEEQLLKVEIIDGYALHWPALQEDLSIAGFFE